MPLPVILKQNHIAAGDPWESPTGNPKWLHNFGGRGNAPPLQESCGHKRSFTILFLN